MDPELAKLERKFEKEVLGLKSVYNIGNEIFDDKYKINLEDYLIKDEKTNYEDKIDYQLVHRNGFIIF